MSDFIIDIKGSWLVWCKRDSSDPLMKELVKRGINLLIPPRDNIDPGSLIIADDDNSIRLADWKVFFGVSPNIACENNGTFVGIAFESSSALSAEAELKSAGNLLTALGLTQTAASAAVDRTKVAKLHISLLAPAHKTLANLDGILEELRRASSPGSQSSDPRRRFIVTGVWRAKGLGLELSDKSGALMRVSADVANDTSAQAKLKYLDLEDGRLGFVADEPLIFGLTLREIIGFQGQGISDRAQENHLKFRADPNSEDHSDFVSSEDAFVTFRDGS